MFERREIEYFLAVVDLGSMTRASQRLMVSQPAVSMAIRGLEKKIKSELFVRRGGSLVLTQAGSALVGPARRIQRDFDAAERAVLASIVPGSQRLDLTIPGILAIYPGSILIAEFSGAYPDVHLYVEDQVTARGAWEAVDSAQTEIGFVTTVVNPSLNAILLGHHTLVATFPPGSPGEGQPMELDELAATAWLAGPPLGFHTRLTIEKKFAERGKQGKYRLQTAHRRMLSRLVLDGVGPSLFIREEAEEMRRFGAVLRPTRPAFSRPYYLVHRREALSPAAEAFVRVAQELSENSQLH